jgi:hypothetical protein
MLLREQNPANRAAMQRKAKLWLGDQSSTVAEMLSDDGDDPVKDAVTKTLNARLHYAASRSSMCSPICATVFNGRRRISS